MMFEQRTIEAFLSRKFHRRNFLKKKKSVIFDVLTFVCFTIIVPVINYNLFFDHYPKLRNLLSKG